MQNITDQTIELVLDTKIVKNENGMLTLGEENPITIPREVVVADVLEMIKSLDLDFSYIAKKPRRNFSIGGF